MSDGAVDISHEARARAYAEPLETLNPAQPELFKTDSHWPLFERLRREAPVHYTAQSDYGAFWSISGYNDIMAVDTNHAVFSSAGGSPCRASRPRRRWPSGRCGRASSAWIRRVTTSSARR